jgi:hypothetical protein
MIRKMENRRGGREKRSRDGWAKRIEEMRENRSGQ